MKKTALVFVASVMLMSSQCSGQQKNTFERFADNLCESLESLGDAMETLGEGIAELVDSEGNLVDSTVTVKRNGRYTIVHVDTDGKQTRISKKDKMLTRKFAAEDFSALSVEYSFQVVMCDTVDSVVVRVNEKLNKHLNVRYNNGKLHIGLNHIDGLTTSDGAKCGYVYLPYNLKLSDIELSGSSVFSTQLPVNVYHLKVDLSGASLCRFGGGVNASQIDIDLSGASNCKGSMTAKGKVNTDLSGASVLEGDIKANYVKTELSGAAKHRSNIKAATLFTDLSGAAEQNLTGKTDHLYVDISGASKLNTSNLAAKEVQGKLSGASNADIDCSSHIKMELSGTSKLVYTKCEKEEIETSRTSKAVAVSR